MTTLSDGTIRKLLDSGELVIDPLERSNIESASVDLRLGNEFIKFIETGEVVDTRNPDTYKTEEFTADQITLSPGEQILGTTVEWIEIPPYLEAEVTGRSTVGRLFIEVHKTAGFCDPGYKGKITLEIQNQGPNPVTLYSGQRLCQIIYRSLDKSSEIPYGHDDSQYQGQDTVKESGLSF